MWARTRLVRSLEPKRDVAPSRAAPSAAPAVGFQGSHDEQMPQLLANRALASPRRAAAHTDFGYGDLVSAGARQSTMANDVATEGTSGPASAFPHLASIESSFGRPVNAVAHTDARAATAARSLGTKASTIGRHVGFAESNPSLFVAAHEAAHSMQNSSAAQAFGGAQQGSVDPMEAHANAV